MQPWASFHNLDTQITIWTLIGLAVSVLLLRRLPAIMALYTYIPAISNWKEAAFTGWFGPIGVGALFYYTIAIEYLTIEGMNGYAKQIMEPVIYFLILSSVVIHGITIPFYFVGTYASKTLAMKTLSNSSPRMSDDVEVKKAFSKEKYTRLTIFHRVSIVIHLNHTVLREPWCGEKDSQ